MDGSSSPVEITIPARGAWLGLSKSGHRGAVAGEVRAPGRSGRVEGGTGLCGALCQN